MIIMGNIMNPNNPTELNLFWQSHIEAWQSSGLTQAAYCKENDLIIHRFGYWKRKLLDTPLVTPEPDGFVTLNPVVVTSPLVLQLPNQLRIEGITPDNLHLTKQLAELFQ